MSRTAAHGARSRTSEALPRTYIKGRSPCFKLISYILPQLVSKQLYTMSARIDTEPHIPPADVEDADHVTVFRYDGVTYLVDSDGANALHCASRSQTLSDMPEAQGRSKLPLSLSALRLWQGAVAGMDSEGALPSEWGASTRVQDLCTLATVCVQPMS